MLMLIQIYLWELDFSPNLEKNILTIYTSILCTIIYCTSIYYPILSFTIMYHIYYHIWSYNIICILSYTIIHYHILSHICDWKWPFYGAYPLIYGNPWSFYIQIHYMQAYFWSPYLSHITRSTCTIKYYQILSYSIIFYHILSYSIIFYHTILY